MRAHYNRQNISLFYKAQKQGYVQRHISFDLVNNILTSTPCLSNNFPKYQPSKTKYYNNVALMSRRRQDVTTISEWRCLHDHRHLGAPLLRSCEFVWQWEPQEAYSATHYENTPIQIYRKFHLQKLIFFF